MDVTEGFFTLKNKEKLYWCTLVPKEIKKVERVLIYFHGVTGSSAYLEFNAMGTLAKLGNCAVVCVQHLYVFVTFLEEEEARCPLRVRVRVRVCLC